jgi:hypothetical protein
MDKRRVPQHIGYGRARGCLPAPGHERALALVAWRGMAMAGACSRSRHRGARGCNQILGTRSAPRSQLTNSKGNVMSLTGWGVLLVVAVAAVAAIVLIIRLIVRHTRGYD